MDTPRRVASGALFSLMCSTSFANNQPIVIAHRAASSYLPEHTLPAVAYAHALGADYIEQDVVLSRDGVPIVLHDIHLDSTTDVAERYPERSRADGRFYAIDFDLEELQTLTVSERRTAEGSAVFPQRFPLTNLPLSIPTLEQELVMIAGMNKSTGRDVGWYIELKAPTFHTQEGFDIAAIVLAKLQEHGLNTSSAKVFLQCFHPPTLAYIANNLKSPLPLIALIGENSWQEDGNVDYDVLKTEAGIAQLADTVDGIGPWIPQLFTQNGDVSELVIAAKREGLLIHPYTVRADQLSLGSLDIDQLHRLLFEVAGVDGVFTDFTDLTRQYLNQRASTTGQRTNQTP